MPVAHIIETLNGQEEPIYLRDAYGERAIREMELALVKACETLPRELDNHQCRTFIAKRICARVEDGERTFGGLVTAAMSAVDELKRRTTPRP
jgi:hypothetical protein